MKLNLMEGGLRDWSAIARDIGAALGEPFAVREANPVGGGCINDAWTLADRDRRFFVKLNRADQLEMFVAEAAGLDEIRRSGAVRVPTPVCCGVAGSQGYLVLEHLDLSGSGGTAADEALGRGLAALHRVTQAVYGWHIDNTIGSTPQHNRQDSEWIRFWGTHRLGFQLELAVMNGWNGLRDKGERLIEALPALLPTRPPASLLHGDLWSGNHAFLRNNTPVIFDPAVYYGDRETDLAMTELFGGFSARFHDAYRETWPLEPGYEIRKTVYNLYHVLNHLNLFGRSYLGQAERMIASLLREVV